jgi:4-aminobutyrate aminotransferase
LAAIEAIEDEHLLENAQKVGNHALARMQAMKQRHATIGDIRGLGLLLGMELVNNGERASELAEEVLYRALAKGLSFKISMGSILTLTPPLTLTIEEMNQALDIIDESLSELEA